MNHRPSSDDPDLTRPQTLIDSWTELPEHSADWQPGQRLGPFRLRQPLGSGGMGLVWLAEQLEPLQRDVAIKVLHPGNQSRLAEAYFEVERQSLAQLSHRAIARIFDAGRLPDGGLFFAMEYVPGQPLDEFLYRFPVNHRQLAEMMIEICSGVEHAHQRGLIHRDLKPGNIVVESHNDKDAGDLQQIQPRIIDFGIAISASNPLDPDKAEYSRAGTRAYMAPEQLSPDASGIDIRADIYALGAVLAECLLIGSYSRQTQLPRFESKSARDMLVSSLSRRSPPAESEACEPDRIGRLIDLPVELRAIAARAMAEKREDRYPTASALAEDLRRWLRHEPVTALPARQSYRLRCFLRRNSLASAAAALILLSVLAGAVVALYGLAEARQGRAEAEAAQSLAEQRRDDAEQLIQFMLGDFASSLRPIGRLDLLDGIGAEALRYLSEQPPGNDSASALHRARALRTLGEVHVQRQQMDLARQVLAQAARLLEPWKEADNQDLAELHFESGQIAFWRGNIAYRERDWSRADVHFNRYLQDAFRFQATSSDATRAEWELAYAYNNLGSLAEARGNPAEAISHLQESARIRDRLMADSGLTGVLGLANNLSWIGRIQNTLGQPVESWQSAWEALELVEQARRENPDDARLRRSEINFRLNLARTAVLYELDDLADELLQLALRLAEEDVAVEPDHPRRQVMLAHVAFLRATIGSLADDRARSYLDLGVQAYDRAKALGFDVSQTINLAVLKSIAELRFFSGRLVADRDMFFDVSDMMSSLDRPQDFNSDYMQRLQLSTELLAALDQKGLPVDLETKERLHRILMAVPVARRSDMRYHKALAIAHRLHTVEGSPQTDLDRSFESIRVDLLATLNEHQRGH